MATATSEDIKYLKNIVQEGKVIVGTDRVLKKLKAGGELRKVFIARNCQAETRKSLEHYAALQKVLVIELELSNEELGIFCKRNHFISVLGSA